MRYLYIMVTSDEYELPMAVADSQAELVKMTGVDPSGLSKSLKRDGWSKYQKIPVNGEYVLPKRTRAKTGGAPKPCMGGGKWYPSTSAAARDYGVSHTLIRQWIKEKDDWYYVD